MSEKVRDILIKMVADCLPKSEITRYEKCIRNAIAEELETLIRNDPSNPFQSFHNQAIGEAQKLIKGE